MNEPKQADDPLRQKILELTKEGYALIFAGDEAAIELTILRVPVGHRSSRIYRECIDQSAIDVISYQIDKCKASLECREAK